jgi:hypothetical protein
MKGLSQEDGDWPIDHRMPYAYGNVNDAYDNYGHDDMKGLVQGDYDDLEPADRRMPLNYGTVPDYYDSHNQRSVDGSYVQRSSLR